MTYLSHIILFVLALIATFFKGVKTDEQGNSTYSDYGLPRLTTAGKVILLLLTLSFLFSILTTWRGDLVSEDREKTLRAQLSDVQKELQRTSFPIRDVFVSFDVYVPLTDESCLSYRKRFVAGLSEYVAKNKIALDDDMLIPSDSGLLPDPNYEPDAFERVNCILFTLNVFKKKIDLHDYNGQEQPDLSLPVTVFVTRAPYVPQDAKQIDGLFCDCDRGRDFNGLKIKALEIAVPPNRLDRTNQVSYANDLNGTQVVISVAALVDDAFSSKSKFEINGFELKVSGRHFELTTSGFDNSSSSSKFRFYTLRERTN